MDPTIKQRLETSGLTDRSEEVKVAFISGYVAGGFDSNRMSAQGAVAYAKWVQAISVETDELLATYDTELVKGIKASIDAQHN